MKNLISVIQEQKDSLPKRQRVLCEYILEHPLEACMLTISELSERSHVGSATVVRTIQALGYDSVNQFKADLRGSAFLQVASSYNAYLDMSHRASQDKEPLQSSLSFYSEYIKNLNNPTFISQIEQAAEQILAAKRVYILGLRSSICVAMLLEYFLRDTGIPITQMSLQSDYVLDYVSEMTSDDLLLSAVFPPVTKRTMEAIRVCQRRSIPTVIISSTNQFPEASTANVVVNTDSFGSAFFTTSSMLAAELLCAAVSQRTSNSTNHSKRLEDLLDENNLTIWEIDD